MIFGKPTQRQPSFQTVRVFPLNQYIITLEKDSHHEKKHSEGVQ